MIGIFTNYFIDLLCGFGHFRTANGFLIRWWNAVVWEYGYDECEQTLMGWKCYIRVVDGPEILISTLSLNILL